MPNGHVTVSTRDLFQPSTIAIQMTAPASLRLHCYITRNATLADLITTRALAPGLDISTLSVSFIMLAASICALRCILGDI